MKIIIYVFFCLVIVGCVHPSTPLETTDAISSQTNSVDETPKTEETANTNEVEMGQTEIVVATGLIQLQDPLDEPEYYCLDLPGYGRQLRLEAALMAHTCKPNAADETFTINYPMPGQWYMEAYDLCVEAEDASDGAQLYLKPCAEQALQYFTQAEDGTIQLDQVGEDTLCLTIASGEGEPTGGPSHLRRDLMLKYCADVDTTLSQWIIPQ